GYLIGTELLKPLKNGDFVDLRVFYIKRSLRILPVFWLIVAIYFLVPVLREAPSIARLGGF
ncbi:MAG TPA: hypothetical protein VG897_10980, partial [Terriglobales bacterium]|nr:hypothetical protein [Terriglobales bacterium]